MKVSLMCVTCTDSSGQSTYVAYGIETSSWGQIRTRKRDKEEAVKVEA